MDPSAGLGQISDEGSASTDRKGPSRQRAELNTVPGSSSPRRPPQESRRKRANEQRYTSWGDGIERAFCARARQMLPETFPVASHGGAATISATVVARRGDALLLCTFSHYGPHLWPDGEVVDDGPPAVLVTGETMEDPDRS